MALTEAQAAALVDGLEDDAATLHAIVHGPEDETVPTDNGDVPTAAKVMADTADAIEQLGEDQIADYLANAENEITMALAAAEAARDKAEAWAEQDEDTEVEAGQYSAKHHATKAEASAAAAAATVSGLANVLTFKGGWDASTAAYPADPDVGDLWTVTVAGTIAATEWRTGDEMIWSPAAAWIQVGYDLTGAEISTLLEGNFSDTAHGNRGGGALHANATGAAAGFMSASDKSYLDGLPSALDGKAASAHGHTIADVTGLQTGLNEKADKTALPVSAPQGRLTLASGVPVMATDVAGATTIYYTPYLGNRVPLYDGTGFVMTAIDELSQTLADTTKSPAAAAANTNYDLFLWSDGGTPRLSRGPAWSSATARGTGAGTSELERVAGLLLNKFAIANGPAAQRGTYVGTIRTNATPAVPFTIAPAAASGGTNNQLYCWNAYNRRSVVALCRDVVTESWNYTTAVWRASRGSAANRVSFIAGLAEGSMLAQSIGRSSSSSASVIRFGGFAYDSTIPDSTTPFIAHTQGADILISFQGMHARAVDIGHHFISMSEYSEATGTSTWYGSIMTLDIEM
ncbi:hypothetical protein [Parvibaculum sp.]|uniref:hypothetical protein n=1 Tax=Parvibaculum sp. TaxID=2024848 RepID=UPI000C557799|nr:hypothetical protein [Parvibaculum sp.]MAM95673.1 hypothetical protein [Parvibaculum sp.]|tara:strand:- start:2334 stop:4055 length:1722 start_codon:yes stop_codon:yes gene_type:complete